ASQGQRLPILSESAVLTRASFPTNALKLVESSTGPWRYELFALQEGAFDVELEYQIQPGARGAERGFNLPVKSGLVNEVTLTLVNLDVDVAAPAAVSIDPQVSAAPSN